MESSLLVAYSKSANPGFELYDDEQNNYKGPIGITDASDFIVDIREYDVPYHVRVAIDKGSCAVRVLTWAGLNVEQTSE